MADMQTPPMVEPLDPNAAQPPAVEPTAPPAPDQSAAPAAPAQLPDELLKIPAIMALTAGKPPALSGTIKEFQKRPEGKLISENKEPLQQAGFGFYRSLSGDIGVIFNGLYIHGDAIAAADKAGQLKSVAPSFDEISHAVSKAAKGSHPVLTHSGAVPNGPASAPVPAVPQLGNSPVAPAPASVQNKLTAARLLNLKTPPPTGGAQPGAGALLNNILKPVV